ncbi:hypothetical protein [Lewinella cohaerens]|uniref:hypothetical protein n=1 Tax=Lewinella cohaerens TaxID=70995 RepID=UPI0003765A70|nr:hypothetical protein [Lewinella cohaerens]
MRKGRWILIGLLIFGAFTAGWKRVEPLWDSARHDPALGIIYLIIILLVGMTIARVVGD